MQLMNYALVSIIAYSGLFVGMLLIFMGPEEKKPGIKYFKVLQDIIISLAVFFAFYYYKLNPYLIIFLVAIVVVLLFVYRAKYIEKIGRQYAVYALFAIIFYLSSISSSSRNADFFLTEALLIFVYGLPTGSLVADHREKMGSVKRVLAYSYFVAIALALPLLLSKP